MRQWRQQPSPSTFYQHELLERMIYLGTYGMGHLPPQELIDGSAFEETGRTMTVEMPASGKNKLLPQTSTQDFSYSSECISSEGESQIPTPDWDLGTSKYVPSITCSGLQYSKDLSTNLALHAASLPNMYGNYIPKSVSSAMKSPNWSDWEKAKQTEMKALWDNTVWKLVNQPKDEPILRPMWVFAVKYDSHGVIIKYKAHLGKLEEEIYMYQPKGFIDPDFSSGISFVAGEHLSPTNADPCLFMSQGVSFFMAICVYVDDMLIVSDNKDAVNNIIENMKKTFDTKVAALEKADPMSCNVNDYQMAIGCLLWVSRLTRPDIAFAVGFLG
eukprot:Ihof_evm8s139 gene=Ihof_evmTU8s139